MGGGSSTKLELKNEADARQGSDNPKNNTDTRPMSHSDKTISDTRFNISRLCFAVSLPMTAISANTISGSNVCRRRVRISLDLLLV